MSKKFNKMLDFRDFERDILSTNRKRKCRDLIIFCYTHWNTVNRFNVTNLLVYISYTLACLVRANTRLVLLQN